MRKDFQLKEKFAIQNNSHYFRIIRNCDNHAGRKCSQVGESLGSQARFQSFSNVGKRIEDKNETRSGL